MGRLPRPTDFFNQSVKAKRLRRERWRLKEIVKLSRLTEAELTAYFALQAPPHFVGDDASLHPSFFPILGRGSKFVPVPKPASNTALLKLFDDTARRLHVKNYFAQQPEEPPEVNELPLPHWASLPRRPNWDPRTDSKTAPDYNASPEAIALESVIDKAKTLFKRQLDVASATLARAKPVHNTPYDFYKKTKTIKHHSQLIIRPADKNLGLCVSTRTFYKKHVLIHLADTTTYQPDHRSPKDFKKFVKDRYACFLQQLRSRQRFAGLFTQGTTRFLAAAISGRQATQVPAFYLLWKIHKPKLQSRPLAAAHSWITTNLSRLVGFYLLILQREIPEILLNSAQLVKRWDGKKIPESCWLMTLDVKALYPNIPHNLGIEAVKHFMQKTTWSSKLQQFIARALEFILKYSAVQFEDTVYRQVEGTAMGTNMAVPYANLFLAYLWRNTWGGRSVWETKWDRHNNILSEAYPVYYRCRFVDDIFLIASKGFGNYIASQLNRTLDSIKVTATEGYSLPYLDVLISITSDSTVQFQPYAKPFNNHLYLWFNTYHRRTTLLAWLRAEVLRRLTISSTPGLFYNSIIEFFAHCRARGYPRAVLRRTIGNIRYEDRSAVLDKQRINTEVLASKIPFDPLTSKVSISACVRHFQNQLPETLQATRLVDAFVPGANLASKIMRLRDA